VVISGAAHFMDLAFDRIFIDENGLYKVFLSNL
jgi:hypothetical protein